MLGQVGVRPLAGLPSEVNFVRQSWLRTYQHSDAARPVPKELYFQKLTPVVNHLLGSAPTLVAVDKTDNNPNTQVLGFITYDRLTEELPVFHFCFVKNLNRRFGIANLLFNSAGLKINEPFVYTFHAPLARKLKKLAPLATYYPYDYYLEDFKR